MDVKKIIENIVEKVQENGDLKERFEKEPVKVIESIIGMDLPDDIVEKVIIAYSSVNAFVEATKQDETVFVGNIGGILSSKSNNSINIPLKNGIGISNSSSVPAITHNVFSGVSLNHW